jgi:hypothetical protein
MMPPCFVGCRHCSVALFTSPPLPNREAYNDFYSIVDQLVYVWVQTFKEYAVKSLVSYLCQHVNDKAADWYEENWTCPRGKYCLCDAGYARSNNNMMGIEVDWRDIKKQVPPSASLGSFFGALWEFIKQLAIEQQAFLESHSDSFDFPEVVKPGKPIGDRIHGMHPKTAVLS